VLEVGAPERSGESVSIPLRGSLVGLDAARLRNGLAKHYVDDGVAVIVLDARGLAFVDEDGVGALLRLRAEATVKGKQLWLRDPRGQVRDKLALINVLGMFVPSDEEAGEEP